MSVRKREWTTSKGVQKTAWVVDYVDQQGKRRLKTCTTKKRADDYAATANVEVRQGTHTPDSASITVTEAAKLWLDAAAAAGLERTTLDQYKQHVDLHIVPYLGRVKLSQLTTGTVRDFQSKLRTGQPAPGQESPAQRRSPTMVKKVTGSLGSMLADAVERNLVGRNVVRDLRSQRRRGKERRQERRQKGKLKIGVDIPSPAEIKAFIEALPPAPSRWRSMMLTAVFTGLRASELRGLRWSDVDLKKAVIHVRQRADRYHEIGQPKTEAGERAVPVPPGLLNVLREWKLACPKGKLDLVFPTGDGTIEWHSNIIQRALIPTMLRAGVSMRKKNKDGTATVDPDGKPVFEAKYTGMHALRHFYASWSINRKADGGLELPPKVVQERMGHSSITVTLDTYGHLFPRGNDTAELEEAEKALFAAAEA